MQVFFVQFTLFSYFKYTISLVFLSFSICRANHLCSCFRYTSLSILRDLLTGKPVQNLPFGSNKKSSAGTPF